jgi:protein involved in polysaccharide export with SLBB domain
MMRINSFAATASLALLALGGCSSGRTGNVLPPASFVGSSDQVSENYEIGPADELSIYVWRNPELSTKIAVRPDGRITTPLITDMVAVGKTPAQLADASARFSRATFRIRSSRSWSSGPRAPSRSKSASSARPCVRRRSRIVPT